MDYSAIVGGTSADMFTQALKAAAKKGKSDITSENVRKPASTMTWENQGVRGPIEYPNSTLTQFPACFSSSVSKGSPWVTAVSCSWSAKTDSPNLRTGE